MTIMKHLLRMAGPKTIDADEDVEFSTDNPGQQLLPRIGCDISCGLQPDRAIP